MENKYGITNLLPLILLGVEVGNVADAMGRTKGMARYMHLTALFDEVVALGNVDFKQVRLEIGELDESERAHINDQIKAKFDIVDDVLEGVIEEAIDVVEEAAGVVVKSISLADKVKALKKA